VISSHNSISALLHRDASRLAPEETTQRPLDAAARHCFPITAGYSPAPIGRERTRFDADWRQALDPARNRLLSLAVEEKTPLITPALAQAAGSTTPPMGDFITTFLIPMMMVFAIVYILIIRPQKRRQKEHDDLIKNIRRGDTVTTSGGLIGKVSRVVDDAEIELEIAQNVKVRTVRSMITDVRAKGEPVKE
jgi:preprotein translocase subunit YajC